MMLKRAFIQCKKTVRRSRLKGEAECSVEGIAVVVGILRYSPVPFVNTYSLRTHVHINMLPFRHCYITSCVFEVIFDIVDSVAF
jgi:hypothetical protein